MMRVLAALFGAFLFSCSTLMAQNEPLYMPKNIVKAYEQGTRSLDGEPRLNYWQNHSKYQMQVTLQPKKRRITGSATITYFNESPDSLKNLRLKLQHDLYKKGASRSDAVNPEDVDNGVDIQSISLNGVPVPSNKQSRSNTFLDLKPGRAIPAKSSCVLEIKWAYTMPTDPRATRECVCDASTFFVSYWYPQMAVYDDLHGWANTPYNGLQEFYNDFSDYDVTIEMPKNYMVWATGEWQNPESILQPAFLEKFKKAHINSDITPIITASDLKTGEIFQKSKKNIFHFKAMGVPDFTFAASDHYLWDASSVVVDDRTGRRTFVSAAYKETSKDFYRVARIAADGIRLMSTWLPGYPFPYPCMTIFNGNDGMEYPMMVNDASVGDGDPTSLTLHETAHTYFPFMMGINEQYYAFMDEGWANFFHFNLTDSLAHDKENLFYSFGAGNDFDVPPMVPSRFLDGQAYSIASYGRPQAAYLVLMDFLGYEMFHKCMTTYMDRWKGKHPAPWDFFNTFSSVSGQDLNWFWKPWFYEWGYPDLALTAIVKDENEARQMVVIERVGSLPTSVYVKVEYTDGDTEMLYAPATVWKNGEKTLRLPAGKAKVIKKAKLGNYNMADKKMGNNSL